MRGGPRDSDASFASYTSNRPSTGAPRQLDPTSKQASIRRINTYLISHNSPYSLSLKPLPSNHNITETLKFILSRLDLTFKKLDEDLLILLKTLNCPHKLSKSALKAPGTPHSFPHVLAVINWLVQIAGFTDDRLTLDNSAAAAEESLYTDLDHGTALALGTYRQFMSGDDDTVDAKLEEYTARVERERDACKARVECLKNEGVELEESLERFRSGPWPLEAIEVEIQDLVKDKQKFEDFVAKLKDGVEVMDRTIEGKEKELAVAVEEKASICKEIEELRKRVENQKIDSWAADRLRREMQAVEREIRDAEMKRTELEENSWSVGEKISQELKDLEVLSEKLNQLLRSLKLPSDLQYRLNLNGSTVVEVMGIDSKETIKPAIKSLGDEIKKSSMANSEELLVLQQQSDALKKKIEATNKHISELRHSIVETEAQMSSLEKELEIYKSRCAAEAENMCKVFEAEAQNVNTEEREAKQTLMAAKVKLEETERQTHDKIQRCANELAALIDSVSIFKEKVEGKIDEMRKEFSETAKCVSEAHKLPAFREAKKAKK